MAMAKPTANLLFPKGSKEIFAPYGKVFPILTSSITLSLTVALLSAIIAIMTARL